MSYGYPYPGQPSCPPGYPSAPSGGHFCSPVEFVPSTMSPYPPPQALKYGYQTDGAGDLWSAVAKTQWGTIPGKAKDGTCWYAFGGKEHYTKDFFWITSVRPVELRKNTGSPPHLAVHCGFQNDGAGYLYAAIAETQYGRIPGKAKDGNCWYSYGDKEHHTSNFHWLVMA